MKERVILELSGFFWVGVKRTVRFNKNGKGKEKEKRSKNRLQYVLPPPKVQKRKKMDCSPEENVMWSGKAKYRLIL